MTPLTVPAPAVTMTRRMRHASWVLIIVSVGTVGSAAAQPARPFPFMQEIEQVLRELRSQIKDPAQNVSSLELVKRLKENSVGASKAVPPAVAALPAAQQ